MRPLIASVGPFEVPGRSKQAKTSSARFFNVCPSMTISPNEDVAGTACSESEGEAWAAAVRADQAVVDVDPVVADAERVERLSLCGEILLFGRDPGVATRSAFILPRWRQRFSRRRAGVRSRLVLRTTVGLRSFRTTMALGAAPRAGAPLVGVRFR